MDDYSINKRPKPLNTGNQFDDDFYSSVEDVYCDPEEDKRISDKRRMETFNSVCSIKGGTALCNNVDEFEKFYGAPPPDCSSGKCITRQSTTTEERYWTYSCFIEFYGDIVFTKVKENPTHSIYACKLDTGLMIDNQYILVIVPKNTNRLGSREKLSTLHWESFQCRKLSQGFNIQGVNISPTVTPVMKGVINISKRTDQGSQYTCETLPILTTLLHKKVGENLQYNDTGKLYLALNSFDTIITFL